jgi:hypothetical protein
VRSRKHSLAFALFVLTLVGSSGFAACASLKSASPVDGDSGTGAEPDGTTGTVETTDAPAPQDALDDAPLTDADDAGRSLWPLCTTAGALCSCTAWSLDVDSSSCAAADFPSGFCCADPGWPAASNASCTCGAWTCHTTGTGTCVCGAFEGGTAGSSCTDTFCCAHPFVDTCGCASTSNAACPSAFADANNVPVASCALANQPCPRGGTRVSSCTF